MTTLAYKDGILAFDGKITAGNMVTTLNSRKGIATDKYLAAAAGLSSFCGAFLEWVKTDFDPVKVPKTPNGKLCDIVGLVIDRKGTLTEYCDDLLPLKVGRVPFYARGSGREVATGAMAAGASAEEAVRIASKFDIYTGGRIRTVKFSD
jgi:ATP-dependent protease HslVU (ClpYQ) peptidase subunit